MELSPEAMGVLEQHLGPLGELGFQVESFGGTTLLVRAIPTLVASEHPREVLEDIAAALLAGPPGRSGSGAAVFCAVLREPENLRGMALTGLATRRPQLETCNLPLS